MLRGNLYAGLLSLAAAPSSAVLLYATSYNDGTVTTLDLDVEAGTLKTLSKSTDCGSEPAWLTLDRDEGILWCLGEGWSGDSSIASYKTSADGTLETLGVWNVTKSAVSSTLYGPNNSGLAVAHYDSSTFSTYSIEDPSALELSQNETYTLAEPGPVPDRQDVPHLHDAILDPTGQFLLVPDLGSDFVRIYAIVPDTIEWVEQEPVKANPGSGPRHGAFAVFGEGEDKKTYFYLANELSNTISGFEVTYGEENPFEFQLLFDFSTHGPGGSVPNNTKAAEIEVSPDNKFVIVSSRGENLLKIPNFDKGSNVTQIPSDPLVTFAINSSDGSLELVQEAPAGGRNPRGFSLNKDGSLVASALQDDNRVVIYERDVDTGELGSVVAWATVGEGDDGNGPNYVLFDE